MTIFQYYSQLKPNFGVWNLARNLLEQYGWEQLVIVVTVMTPIVR